MNALLTLNVVALALFAWISVMKIIPSCTTSFLRHRLWRLRDQLYDEIRMDAFDDVEQPKALLDLVESAIENASHLTALNVLLIHLSSRDVSVPNPFDLDALTPRDRTLMEARMEEFALVSMNKALGGSPSGWALLIVLTPIVLVITVIGRLFRGKRDGQSLFDDARRHVRDEFEIDPVVVMMSKRNRSRHSLYQHV